MQSRRRAHTLTGIAAGLAAFAATAALAVTRDGGSPPALTRPLRPEGVPIPKAAPLARPRVLRIGEQIDGITCQLGEQVAFHIHAHLRLVVRGQPRDVPAGVGIAPPYQVAPTPAGRFVAGGSCFMWLHTHAADGIVHIESPVNRTFTLGEFFDVWGQPLGRRVVGRAHGAVTAFDNGRVFAGNPRKIPLRAHSQIELEIGPPVVVPETITFPPGL
jgi:hypothetical protein